MELRDLMNEIEVLVEKARNDFNRAAHGTCREHLLDLAVLLNQETLMQDDHSCESDESSSGL